jgi:hypothetical protein
MIGAMKSPEAQYQLAMRLPLAQLQAILRGQPSEIDQPTALTVLKQRMQQKTAMQGMQAQQELQQPSVKDRMLQQAQMPEDMGIAQAPGAQQAGAIPDGGVAGFAEGGDVRHFEQGGRSTVLRNAPYQMYGPQYDPEAEPASMETWRRIRDFILPQTGPQLSHLGEDKHAAEKARLASAERQAALPRPAAVEPGYRGKDYVDPRLVDTKALEPVRGPARRPAANAPVGVEQLEQLSGEGSGYTPPEVTAAAAPAATDTAGITALSTSTAPAAPAAPADTTYEGEFGKIGSSTQPYMDKMSALLRTMTPTAEEKESRSAERKGVMALKAAQALLQSGTTSGAARGSALGQIAELTQAYGKEDREDKKAMIGAEMNMLGAQAQLAQGNARMAIESFQHAQKLAFEGIRLAADNYYKDIEAKLKKQGLDDNKAAEEARNLTSRYIVDQQSKWHKDNYNAEFAKLGVMKPMYEAHGRYYDAAARAAGQLKPIDIDRARDNAALQMNTVAKRTELKNRPEFKGMSDAEIKEALAQQEMNAISRAGIGALNPTQTNPAFGQGTPPAGATVRP